MKKYYVIIIGVVALLCGCNSHYKLLNRDKAILKINLNSYKLYQFTMYRDLASTQDKLLHPEFTDVEQEGSTTHEILYLLRDTLSNNVIYLTTYSHKYLYKNRGVFNDPIYKDNLIFNDLDHVYLGRESPGKFSFYNPRARSYAHNLHMYFNENGQGIVLEKVTNNYAKERDRIKNPFVHINEDVFGFMIKFNAIDKQYSFIPYVKGKRTMLPKQVDSMYVQGTNVFLKLRLPSDDKRDPFFRNRVQYVKPY